MDMPVRIVAAEYLQEHFLPKPVIGPGGDFDQKLLAYAEHDEEFRDQLMAFAQIIWEPQSEHLSIQIKNDIPFVHVTEFIKKKKFENLYICIECFQVQDHIKAIRYWLVPRINGSPRYDQLGIQGIVYLIGHGDKWAPATERHPAIQELFENVNTLESLQKL